MSFVTRRGKPRIFIKMTCNNEWPELNKNNSPHQTAIDRPGLCPRAFKLRLSTLTCHLRYQNTFGDLVYHMYTVGY